MPQYLLCTSVSQHPRSKSSSQDEKVERFATLYYSYMLAPVAIYLHFLGCPVWSNDVSSQPVRGLGHNRIAARGTIAPFLPSMTMHILFSKMITSLKFTSSGPLYLKTVQTLNDCVTVLDTSAVNSSYAYLFEC